MASIPSNTSSVWLPRTIAAILILGSAAARIAYLGWFSDLNLAPDEAHYWDWSRNLDWAYYSKGPLVALLIRGSCELFGSLSLAWTGSEALAVRLPAVVCGILLSVGLYVLITQVWRSETWAVVGLAIGMTFPLIAAGSSLITIDAPFTCLWTWALVTGFEAVVHRKTWAWPATGLFIALGILAKPTMVLFGPCLALLLLSTSGLQPRFWRKQFWTQAWTAVRGETSRHFWTLASIAALGALPILYWNSQNDWVTFRHTGTHAGLNSARSIHPLGPLTYLGTQMAVLLVYWFIAWACAMWRYRPWNNTRVEEQYLWWMSVPIFIFFALFSFKNGGGEPNWPIACYLSGMVLTIGWIREQLTSPVAWIRRTNIAGIATVACLGIAATVIVHFPRQCQPLFIAIVGQPTAERAMPLRRIDPTARMRGWPTLAQAVDARRAELRKRGIEPVLAGMNWTLPGEISFYMPDHPTLYALGPVQGERHSQYDLWRPNPRLDKEQFLGKSFVFINADLPILQKLFDEVERRDIIEYREGDHMISYWSVSICHGFRGCEGVGNDRY